MTTKQFRPGELLTAQDVNQYLVNDDTPDAGATAIVEQFQALIARIEAAQSTLPSVKDKAKLYRFSFDDYNRGSKPSLRDWTAIFDDAIEIVYVAVTPGYTVNNTNTIISGNKLKIPATNSIVNDWPFKTDVYFRIKG
ncbi:hypothetical protein [uncultured Mobiluncus sp.]|uniref:hypothetical protein n=1 Tax=uncultured Mobiluncus sp. TaxID=293425 RepID=UPI00261E80D7|nr:hypothetical protein [uncultured Mobiluncus sp.]